MVTLWQFWLDDNIKFHAVKFYGVLSYWVKMFSFEGPPRPISCALALTKIKFKNFWIDL